ncbi:unnamed protein product [Acanthoscelides obtectus]|uniref:Uncharacterized protein n=1 Tax=Acanthoscelides obtectus TaxID=200917 RepID=A0A9P0KH12_ACAOB|nr:unnamed protein product [Acanthoscelides obtectus]CAK1661610.1 hypothetical protein AOBTE_LOCUS22717 [Acanthoscelides obtectus]
MVMELWKRSLGQRHRGLQHFPRMD